MDKKFTLRIGDHLNTAAQKRIYTEKVFSEIAPRYDFITRALSFWRDASWKRTLISWLPAVDVPFCVDLACGTGDLAFSLADKYPNANITGLDIAEPMLALARSRRIFSPVRFIKGDMASLPFPSHSQDIVTGGYALRNAPDLKATIVEINRILKTGGLAAFLDFSKPDNKKLQRLEYWILKIWTGFWGILFHRNHEVYSYIAESLEKYPSRPELHQLFKEHGFTVLRSRLNFLGITEILLVRKDRSYD
jgi:ubiquinone/menaquinone biosynthesis methyltransferase